MLVYISIFLKFNSTTSKCIVSFHLNSVSSHEFSILSKSCLCSWVVVVDLVDFPLGLEVLNIWLVTSLVEGVDEFMWMFLLERIGVEVVLGLKVLDILLFTSLVESVEEFMWVFLLE